MKSFRLMIFLILFMFSAGACTPKPVTQTENRPLKVGYVLWPGYYPMLIAEEKGLFEAHGVTVETVPYPTIGEEYVAFASGVLDGQASVVGDVLALIQGNNVRIVLVTDFSNGADQVVATADIATPTDLIGKRIGVRLGTFGDLMVRKMLAANDIALGEVTLIDTFPELLQDSIGEQVDAGHTYEPFTSQSLDKGAHVIFDSSQVPGLVADVISFQASVVEDRPEDVQAFVDAWFEALAWWQANPEEAANLLARVTELQPEEISTEGVKLLDLAGNLAAFTRGSDTSSIFFTTQEYINFLGTVGLLSIAPDLDTLLDPSFLK